MPRRSLSLSLLVFTLFVGNGLSPAQDSESASSQAPVVEGAPGLPPTASVPVPVTTASPLSSSASAPHLGVTDAANTPKYFTITASLREEYDDNIYTTRDNKKSSFVTEFSPSFLFNVPMQDSTFSARYTFGLDYYESRSGNQIDYTHEALVHYTHNFSDRFTFDARDQFGYYTEPDLLQAVGTPFQNGGYIANTAIFQFNAQWTPLFGTATTYSNIAVFYQDGDVAQFQNSDENTLAQDFRFAFAPKFNFIAGGIFDDISYFDNSRGYTNYTLDFGVDWQALPSLSLGARVGASLTESDLASSSSLSPYAALTLDWQLGKRSKLTFSYTHDIVPTDEVDAVGQEADRFSIRFAYDITPRITVHLEGIETYSDYTSELIEPGTVPEFHESDVGVDFGFEYHLNSNFGFEAGYLLSDVSSELGERDYTRNQIYVGIRGTY